MAAHTYNPSSVTSGDRNIAGDFRPVILAKERKEKKKVHSRFSERSVCICLLNVGIKGMCHHTLL